MPRRHKNAVRKRKIRAAVRPAGKCWMTGKYRFRTQPEAEAALQEVREKRQAAGVPEEQIEKRVYHHAVCGMWHMTRETEGEYAEAKEAFDRGEHEE